MPDTRSKKRQLEENAELCDQPMVQDSGCVEPNRINKDPSGMQEISQQKSTGKHMRHKIAIEDDDEEDEEEDDDGGVEDDDDSFIVNSESSDEEDETDREDSTKKMLDALQKVDETAYGNMKDVLEIINSKNPNIMNILKIPMRQKDRATIVELYEIFKKTHPSTEDWIELRFKLNYFMKKYEDNFREYNKYTAEQLADIKQKSQLIKKDIIPEFALKYKILTLNTCDANKAAIYKKYQQFKRTNPTDEERSKLKSWIDYALALPHNNVLSTIDFTKQVGTLKFMEKVINSLNSELYGMHHVKEQLLLFLNSKLTNPNMKGCSLALVGPPGVGKTTIARYLAEIMEWPFEQISFGGAASGDFLKGHDYTYVGSKPGEIARCLSAMKHKNGILFLDEYEKVSENKDIASCLLHVTDFQQNHEFRDNYLSDILIDLSQLWFIYSMNELPTDSALRDRLFVINIPAYNKVEKTHILKDFVIPKALRNIGRKSADIDISEEVSRHIVTVVSDESSGVRRIEQIAKDLINKLNFIVLNQDSDGNIPGSFNFMSFAGEGSNKIFSRLSYPIRLTSEMFDQLFLSIEMKSSLPFGMYM